jgi:Zn-dependent peptidase ImmA (M78 family)/transcriptional regulator with XRE-family HTH domain
MNGEQLKRAREIRGLTQAELADDPEINVTQAAIARMEQNLFTPSDELAHRLAHKLAFPFEFFYETADFDFPLGSLLFRCLKGLKSKDRSQIVQTAWVGYKLYDFMAKRLRIKPSSFPRISSNDPIETTQILRSALGIEAEAPIRHLVNKLERSGVVIISIPLEIHGHDGFSLWIHDRPVMVLSGSKPGDRQRRTAAHEAIHLAAHYAVTGNLDEMEDEADALTNELLLPENIIRNEIVGPVTLSGLTELKPRWGVSIQSLVERSHELGIITANQRKYLWKQISINKWRWNEPAPIEPEKPKALQKMAELLYGTEKRIDYRKLASDANLPFDLVREILRSYEGFRYENVSAEVIQFPTFETDADSTFPKIRSGS